MCEGYYGTQNSCQDVLLRLQTFCLLILKFKGAGLVWQYAYAGRSQSLLPKTALAPLLWPCQ